MKRSLLSLIIASSSIIGYIPVNVESETITNIN